MATVQDEIIFQLDGQEFRQVMVWDDDIDEPQPVVMVCGTILGRNDFAVQRASALHALGYVGVVLDVYGDGYAADDPADARPLMDELRADRETLRERLAANIDFVASQPNVDSMKMAVIGYCFGGLCALDIARSRDDILAVASFHGVLTPPSRELTSPINAKVLVLHGNEDPLAPDEDVDALRKELTQRGADWQLHTYGSTYHSFAIPTANNPDKGLKYNEFAQYRSWRSLEDFLRESL